MEIRLKEIENLDLFLKDKQKILNNVLNHLGWNEASLVSEMKVPCPINPSHFIPESALPHHREVCEWIEEGYAREELKKQPPDSSFYYEKASDVVPVVIDCNTVKQVLSECGLLGNNHNKPLNLPKTYERWTVEFNREQRLAIYDHIMKVSKAVDKPKNVTIEDLMIDFEKKEEGEKPKSQLEILAEMRDYKRRRQSYRAKNVHITKKSYTEIMKEVIENQTSFLAETKKIEVPESSKREHKDSARNTTEHNNYYSDESSSDFKEKHRNYQEHRDHSKKYKHHHKSSSRSPKRKKHKRDRSRSKSPSHHKHKKSHKHKRSHE